ncbi:MAG TPA: hypothetical protein VNN72_12875 [Polyangiaceae bacterium]|nr:hypothetical protein [Polyangiaceae bacterium]
MARDLRRLLEKIGKERAVMDERLAKLFGFGAPFSNAPSESARGAIVLNDRGVLDGQIRDAIVEGLGFVTTCRHHRLDELVGANDRARRVVDERQLQLLPFRRKPVPGAFAKAAQVKVPHAALALAQRALRKPLIAVVLHGTVVFRAELVTKAPVTPDECGAHQPDDQHEQKEGEGRQDGQLPIVER